MRKPSIATLVKFGFSEEKAKEIRRALNTANRYDTGSISQAMQRVDKITEGFGVEYQRAGSNEKSPSFSYVNQGDTYATTIICIRNHHFIVGCWGDIVEKGNYE